MLALAHRFEQLVETGVAADYADLARLGHVTRGRVTQIMGLLGLAPDIQEAILFWPPVTSGKDSVTERRLEFDDSHRISVRHKGLGRGSPGLAPVLAVKPHRPENVQNLPSVPTVAPETSMVYAVMILDVSPVPKLSTFSTSPKGQSMSEPMSEWKTRKTFIDSSLKKWGREIVPFDPAARLSQYTRHAVEEYPTKNGPADYALFVAGRCLGVVEAKRLAVGPQAAVVQAERYSKGMTATGPIWGTYRVPFLYATNGELIWFRDIRDELNQTRNVAEFHTPAALEELINRDFETACANALALPNDQKGLRAYQKEANAKTEQAIAEHKRQMLIAMATGTGGYTRLCSRLQSRRTIPLMSHS